MDAYTIWLTASTPFFIMAGIVGGILYWQIRLKREAEEKCLGSKGNWRKYSTLGDLRNFPEEMAKRMALRRMIELG